MDMMLDDMDDMVPGEMSDEEEVSPQEEVSPLEKLDRYNLLFNVPWSETLSVKVGSAPTQVLINDVPFAIAELDYAVSVYVAVGPVVELRIDLPVHLTSRANPEVASLQNVEARHRVMAFVSLAIQNGEYGTQLRGLHLNLYNSIGNELPILFCANRLTVLKVKEVHWTKSAYLSAHFGAIEAMTFLREFAYKYTSYLADKHEPHFTLEKVVSLLKKALLGKPIHKLGFDGLQEVTANHFADIINGLRLGVDGLSIKIKRCHAMEVHQLGVLLSAEARVALTKLKIHAVSPTGSGVNYSSFTGLTNLSAAKFVHEPKIDEHQVANLVEMFLPNITSLVAFKNRTGFKLGINHKTPAVTFAAMTRGLIDYVDEHKDDQDSSKPKYTWLCTLPTSRHTSSGRVHFRLRVYMDEEYDYF